MSTETAILLAAERLFAVEGIGATSLRRIGKAAGQRNTAAVQYHFTGKDELIRAVFRHRQEVIGARRRELLRALEGERPAGPRGLVEALVRPLAEQAARPGSHYVRFLHRVFEHTGHDTAALSEISGLDEAAAIGGLLADRLPFLAEPGCRFRPRWAGRLIITSLADLEQRLTAPGAPDPEEFATALTDAATGLLTAPPTPPPGPAQ
ncbi:TetR family transcriptional regulator [Nocardiopsis sp. CNT-189]|uniref:TetR family transcriptional regulator n=1 Tax=Nocardiopsis oceanisediminis TaxID=2816862 RepID=UPI003B3BBBE4